jgi:DNA (cytosine-5)-methyltransferase 1
VAGRVCELFAGVGGFRLGLSKSGWEVVWSDQWEPGRKVQYASDCYASHFGRDGHQNKDITTVPALEIPDHDLLVGGFPCQDYSVATANAKGIEGRKGVLWWEIRRILEAKRPPYLLLENVDRLLKSPTNQRGRDFGVMLWCLNSLGYSVEWRLLNAADYSAPQRRRRVFIFGAHERTSFGTAMLERNDPKVWVERDGFFAPSFAVVRSKQAVLGVEPPHKELPSDLKQASDRFALPFLSAGLMSGGRLWTYAVESREEKPVPLGSVLQRGVDHRFAVPKKDLPKWKYLKGAKAEPRKASTGFEYRYNEGPLPFPDPLDRPSRTMLTDEGGLSPSRFKHIVLDPETQEYRVITPVEAERLNQFPDDWTNTGMPERSRYFCMGNALVVGLVERMGVRLRSIESHSPPRPTIQSTTSHRRAIPAA